MDPISAVGFASGILTFVDFSYKLIRSSYEIYQSNDGANEDNKRLSTVVNDLNGVAKPLSGDVKGNNLHVAELKRIATDCSQVAEELAKILKDIERKEGNKVWRSLEATWKNMRKEKKVASLEQRLITYRLQVLLRLNLILNDEQSGVKSQLEEIQEKGVSLSTESFNKLIDAQRQMHLMERRLIGGISESLNASDAEQMDVLAEIQTSLSALSLKLETLPKVTTIENTILRRLYFNSMYSRESIIFEAEGKTFKWLLKDKKDKKGTDNGESSSDLNSDSDSDNPDHENNPKENNKASSTGDSDRDSSDDTAASKRKEEEYRKDLEAQSRTRESFLTWLNSGKGIYHISGKAGSGKSTLMKYLCQHDIVAERLQKWAAPKELVFVKFFFWNPGDIQQKNLEGLFRSLLLETLRQSPELMKECFPQCWEAAHRNIAVPDDVPFSFPELKKALDTIVRTHNFPSHRFCFFIDGLDEFEGDSTDHWELAQS